MKKSWKQQGLAVALTAGLLLSPVAPALAADELSFDLDQIVVTATKTEKKVKDVPAAVEVITKEDLARKNITTLDDAFKGISGIYFNRGKGIMDTTTNISMRGFNDDKRIAILMDGQPQGDGYTNGVLWNNLPVENIERIEIIKGPASALYGSSAMGGVINIITKSKVSKENFIKLQIGEQGTENKTISSSNSTEKIDYFINYNKYHTDGYITNDRDLPGTIKYEGKNGADKENYGGKIIYRLNDNDKLTLNVDKSDFTYFREVKPDKGNYKTQVVGLAYDSKLNDKIDLKMTMQSKERDSWYVSGTYTATSSKYTHNVNETRVKDAGLQMNWKLSDKDLLTLGYNYRGEKSTSQDEENLLTPVNGMSFTKSPVNIDKYGFGKTETKSFYFQNEHKVNDKFNVFLGGSYDDWKAYDGKYKANSTSPITTLQERNANKFSGKVGMVYKKNDDVTFRASVGQAFRTPTCYELYRTWQSSTGILYIADPNLKPEKSDSYEAGVDYKINSDTLITYNYFNSNVDDLIQRVTNGTQSKWVNTDKAKIKGHELGIKQKINKNWSAFANYNYTDAKTIATKDSSVNGQSRIGKQLEDVPKETYNIGFNYKDSKWDGCISGRYASDPRDDGADGKYATYQSYFVVDTKISYLMDKNSTLSLSVDNLFDKNYYLYDLCPPRTVSLELTKKF